MLTIKRNIKKKLIDASFTKYGEEFQELDILRELTTHGKNVLELVDSFEEDGKYVIVTRYMEGGSLLDYLIAQEEQALMA